MDAHDLGQPSPRGEANRQDVDDLARGNGRCHDSARARPPDGNRPPLRAGAVDQRPGRAVLEPGLLQSGRQGRHRLRSHRDRQQCHRPVCAPDCALPGRHGLRSGGGVSLVPSLAVDLPNALWRDSLGHAGRTVRPRSVGYRDDEPLLVTTGALDRRPTPRRRGSLAPPPASRSGMVAQRVDRVLPETVPSAASCRSRRSAAAAFVV